MIAVTIRDFFILHDPCHLIVSHDIVPALIILKAYPGDSAEHESQVPAEFVSEWLEWLDDDFHSAVSLMMLLNDCFNLNAALFLQSACF